MTKRFAQVGQNNMTFAPSPGVHSQGLAWDGSDLERNGTSPVANPDSALLPDIRRVDAGFYRFIWSREEVRRARSRLRKLVTRRRLSANHRTFTDPLRVDSRSLDLEVRPVRRQYPVTSNRKGTCGIHRWKEKYIYLSRPSFAGSPLLFGDHN